VKDNPILDRVIEVVTKAPRTGWCLGRRCGHRASSYVCYVPGAFVFPAHLATAARDPPELPGYLISGID